MRRCASRLIVPSSFFLLSLCTHVSADVNLSLQTVVSPVQVGDTVEVRLNIAGTPSAQNVGFVRTILTWDPTKLELLTPSQSGALAWTSAGFYVDGPPDNLNAGFPPVPNNDGNAIFQARANTPFSIPTGGARVTTFRFLAIDTGVNSAISVPMTLGTSSMTIVLNSDVPFGQHVPIASISNTTVTINCTSSVQCNDGNPCTDDSCVSSQCQYVNDNSNNPNDGLRCNGVEQSCSNGNIIYAPGMGPVNCSSLNTTCTVGVCNEPSGSCSANPINENGACNDGQFCTSNDRCVSGTCVGMSQTCPIFCNETTDQCVLCLTNAHCDDGFFCNTLEQCVGGVCMNGPDPCPPPNDICLETTDTCVQCLSNADCSDGNFCNGVEVCVSNVCQAGTAPCSPGDVCCEATDTCAPDCCSNADCADPYPCSADICGVGGECVHFPDATGCQDAFFCNGAERCLENPPGVFSCAPPAGPACSVGQVCCEATDTCATNCCTNADCIDVNYCNGVESCVNGTCAPGMPVDCSHLNTECRVGVCNEPTDTCVTQSINQGGFCNDQSVCTYNDRCNNGVCDGCEQGEAGCAPQGCVNLSWEPATQNALVGSTVQVKLIAKSCNATSQMVDAVDVILGWNPSRLQLATSTSTNPNPQDPCTPSSCPPSPPYLVYDWLSSGFGNDCALDAINAPCSGTPANDGNAFYTALAQLPPTPTAFANSAGLHVTTFKFVVLPGPSGATTLSFTPCFSPSGSTVTRVIGGAGAGTVVTGTLGPAATINVLQCTNNAQCNDGLVCNGIETCVNNACVPGNPVCTNPNLPVCIEPSGMCVACTQNSHCSDGLFCTGTELCQSNNCVPGIPPCGGANPFCNEAEDRCVQCLMNDHCMDGISCTDDSCILGTCYNVGNDASCQDGVFCNGAEICVPGQGCMSPGNPCCDPFACNEANDTCGGGCPAPSVLAIGSRWLSVTPAAGVNPVALLVTGDPNDPFVSCLSKYVQANGTLGDTPVFQTPAQWGTVFVRGLEIRPRRTYTVCTSCPSGFSAKSTARTWRYGDGNNNNTITLDDILCVLNGFGGSFGTPPTFCTIYSVDNAGPGCIPNLLINLDDILGVLGAFGGQLDGSPVLCPAFCP